MEEFGKAVNQGETALQGFIEKLNEISGKGKTKKQAPIKGLNEKTGFINVTAGGDKF